MDSEFIKERAAHCRFASSTSASACLASRASASAACARNSAAVSLTTDIVDDIRRSGITTVRGIAEELHVRGIRAPRGDTWHPTAVSRLLARL
jgi:hypothetical protein